MNPEIYKLIHLVGIIVTFLGIGSLISADAKKPAAMRAPAMIHGIGLLLLLVSGFGLQAKVHKVWPAWMVLKVVILLALGALIVLIKRKVLPPIAIYLIAIVLGGIAAYLGFSNGVVSGVGL